jgi:hypothetical protein
MECTTDLRRDVRMVKLNGIYCRNWLEIASRKPGLVNLEEMGFCTVGLPYLTEFAFREVAILAIFDISQLQGCLVFVR